MILNTECVTIILGERGHMCKVMLSGSLIGFEFNILSTMARAVLTLKRSPKELHFGVP